MCGEGIDQEVAEIAVEVFPVPFTSDISFRLNLQATSKVYIAVLDLSGRMLMDNSFDLTAGMNEFTLSASGLQAGTYLYRISTEEGTTIGTINKVQ